MKKVIISGACGFVGNYLIKELLNNGYEILACDIHEDNNLPDSVNYCCLDILNNEQIDNIVQTFQPDYFINLAAISSVGMSWNIPQKTFEVNVIGVINILEALRKYAPNCKTLLIGSSEEYDKSSEKLSENAKLNANNPYGISKIAQENVAKMYMERYGMRIVCTRSFNHTGVGQKDTFVIPSFCKQIAEIAKSGSKGTIYVGNLSAYRDFSDVEDVVHVYRMLLENDNSQFIYNVGSGNSYKIEELLNYIISLANVEVDIVIDKEKYRPIDNPYICCNNESTKKYFNNTDVKKTIQKMYNYYYKK